MGECGSCFPPHPLYLAYSECSNVAFGSKNERSGKNESQAIKTFYGNLRIWELILQTMWHKFSIGVWCDWFFKYRSFGKNREDEDEEEKDRRQRVPLGGYHIIKVGLDIKVGNKVNHHFIGQLLCTTYNAEYLLYIIFHLYKYAI